MSEGLISGNFEGKFDSITYWHVWGRHDGGYGGGVDDNNSNNSNNQLSYQNRDVGSNHKDDDRDGSGSDDLKIPSPVHQSNLIMSA